MMQGMYDCPIELRLPPEVIQLVNASSERMERAGGGAWLVLGAWECDMEPVRHIRLATTESVLVRGPAGDVTLELIVHGKLEMTRAQAQRLASGDRTVFEELESDRWISEADLLGAEAKASGREPARPALVEPGAE